MRLTLLTSLAALLFLVSAASPAQSQSTWGYAPSAGAGLILKLGSGSSSCEGLSTSYGGGTLGLAPNTVNYIFLSTDRWCAPAAKTTAFTVNDIPLATVITSATGITSISDARVSANATTLQRAGFGPRRLAFYNANHNHDYMAGAQICSWDTFPDDTGVLVTNPTCQFIASREVAPGYNFGAPPSATYPGNQGWQVSGALQLRNTCASLGICNGISVETDKLSPGDSNTVDIQTLTKYGFTDAAGEATTGIRNSGSELFVFYTGNVADDTHHNDANGHYVLHVRSPRNPQWMGTGQALLDLSSIRLARQKITGGDHGPIVATLTEPDGSPLSPPLTPSVCSRLAAPVLTGTIAQPGYTLHITSWSAGPPRDGFSTFTFTFSAGTPAAKDHVLLSGFSNSSPPGLNGYVAQVLSVSGASFTANIFNATAAAIAATQETAATAAKFTPTRLAADGTARMSVVVKTPQNGSFNTTEPFFIEDILPEQTIPSRIITDTGPYQVLEMPLQYEHPANRYVCQGGLAGYRINYKDYTTGSYYPEYITGSLSPNQIREFYVRQSNLTSFSFSNTTVQIMPGTNIVSVINPETTSVDGAAVVVQPTKGFASGDNIFSPNNIAAGWTGMSVGFGGFNPFSEYTAMSVDIPGETVGPVSTFNVSYQQAPRRDTNAGLRSEGGLFRAPSLMMVNGIVENGIELSTGPDGALLQVDNCRNHFWTGDHYTLWQDVQDPMAMDFYPCLKRAGYHHTIYLHGGTDADPVTFWVNGNLRANRLSVLSAHSGPTDSDFAGLLTVAGGARTSNSYTFREPHKTNPVCTLTPQNADLGVLNAMGSYTATVTPGNLKVAVQNAPSANVTFGYTCVARE